jgi:hypothetical protein
MAGCNFLLRQYPPVGDRIKGGADKLLAVIESLDEGSFT